MSDMESTARNEMQIVSLDHALQIVKNCLKIPEKLLRYHEIPAVDEEDFAALDSTLKVELEDDRVHLDEGELLIWARGLTTHGGCNPRNEEDNKKRDQLLMKSLSCGISTNSFDALVRIGENLGLNKVSANEFQFPPLWLNHRFLMARLYKRQGEFLKAIELNCKLSEAISGKDDKYVEARTLLHLAKAAYSHDMRAGMALTLSAFAIERLEDQGERIGRVDATSIWRARALDTKLGIEFELLASSAQGAEKIDRERRIQLLRTWYEAEEFDRSYDRLSMRTAFRRCRAEFDSSDDQEERQLLRVQYRDMLSAVRDHKYDARGMSIRFGHYAEMLAASGFKTEAEIYLEKSIDLARTACDWKTISVNLMRLASIKGDDAARKRMPVDSALSIAKEAREVLKNLSEQPADVHLSHCQSLADLYRVEGNWNGVIESLEDAESYLQKTLDRLNLESEEILFETSSRGAADWNAGRSYSPVGILSEQERGRVNQSIAVDWSIASAHQRRLIRQLSRAVRFRQRADSQRMSCNNLVRYGASIAHKVKNYHANALRPIERLAEDVSIATETRGKFTAAIQEYREQFRTRIDRELSSNLPDESINTTHHSVRQLMRLHRHDMDDLSAIAKELEIKVTSNGGDFYIEGVETAIRLHFFFLLENAARAINDSSDSITVNQVRVSISWHACDEGSNSSSLAFGCVEIADSAGRVNDLKKAVDAVLSGEPTTRWHGLHLALLSFQADYGCNIAVEERSEESMKMTVLRLHFPDGVRIRPT